jgi:hypothetical protein
MSGSTVKQKVLEAIDKLPAGATLEEAIERLVLVDRAGAGRVRRRTRGGAQRGEASAPPVTRTVWARKGIGAIAAGREIRELRRIARRERTIKFPLLD